MAQLKMKTRTISVTTSTTSKWAQNKGTGPQACRDKAPKAVDVTIMLSTSTLNRNIMVRTDLLLYEELLKKA
jgi:hypothetical protein